MAHWQRDTRDTDSIPRLGRSPGEGNGNLLQYSCLENPMDRGAWWATVHGVSKSRTRLSGSAQHSTHYSLKKIFRCFNIHLTSHFPLIYYPKKINFAFYFRFSFIY